MWAARRSGLYYVPINTHLTAAEAAYIIDNSAAKAIIGSAALRKTCENLAEHLPGGLPALLLIADERPRRLAALPGMRCRSTGYPDRRRDRRRPAAVLVGHHRPAEGHQARTAAPPARRGAGHDVGAGRVLDAPGRGLSQPGAAVSHRAVGVVDDGRRPAASPRSSWRSSTPKAAWTPSSATGSRTASSCRSMFTRMLKLPEAVRNSYDLSSLQRVMHAAAPCPVEIKKQMIDWWGPIVDEYYASSEAHRVDVDQRRGVAGPSRARSASR